MQVSLLVREVLLFEIIRDLVEKLPVMIAPRWLLTKSQPIAVRNVIQFLRGVFAF